jgi:hypothetical protein
MSQFPGFQGFRGFSSEREPRPTFFDPSEFDQNIMDVISGIGSAGLKTLDTFLTALNAPGNVIRGMLTGELGTLKSLIPFGETLGFDIPRVSGREVLEDWGILKKNQPGLDATDVAGFAADVITDPLIFLGVGAATKVGQATKSLKKLVPRVKALESRRARGLTDTLLEGEKKRVEELLNITGKTLDTLGDVSKAKIERAAINIPFTGIEAGKFLAPRILSGRKIPFTDKKFGLPDFLRYGPKSEELFGALDVSKAIKAAPEFEVSQAIAKAKGDLEEILKTKTGVEAPDLTEYWEKGHSQAFIKSLKQRVQRFRTKHWDFGKGALKDLQQKDIEGGFKEIMEVVPELSRKLQNPNLTVADATKIVSKAIVLAEKESTVLRKKLGNEAVATLEWLRPIVEEQVGHNIKLGIGEVKYQDVLLNYMHHSITDEGLDWLINIGKPESKELNKFIDKVSILTRASKTRSIRKSVKDVNTLANGMGYVGKKPFMQDDLFKALATRSQLAINTFFKHDYFATVWHRLAKPGTKKHEGKRLIEWLAENNYTSWQVPMGNLPGIEEATMKTIKWGKVKGGYSKRLEAVRKAFTDVEINKGELTTLGMPHELLKDAAKPFAVVQDPKQLKKLFKHMDGIMRHYRGLVTSMWPLYHSRNMMGNIWNGGVLGGVTNPQHWKDAIEFNYKWARPDQLKKFRIKIGGKDIGGEQFLKEAIEDNVMRQGSLEHAMEFYEVAHGIKSKSILGEPSTTFYMDPRKWGRDRLGVPIPVPGYKDGIWLENWARLAHYIGKRRQGFSRLEASGSVRKYLFNYEELSAAEKIFGKRAFFFYTWTRKNTPLVFEHAFHPSMRMWAASVGKTDEPVEEMPEWLRSMGVFAWKGKADTWKTLNLGLPPQEPLQFGDIGKMFAQASPTFRIPIEQALGTEAFTGRKLSEIDKMTGILSLLPSQIRKQLPGHKETPTGYERIDPRLNRLLRVTPFSRFASTPFLGAKTEEGKVDIPSNILNFLLAKKRTVHPSRIRITPTMRKLIERMQYRGDIYPIKNLYGATPGTPSARLAALANLRPRR